MTPALTGTLLPGVTRDSLLTLAEDLGYTAEEGKISTDEWRDQAASGQLTEVFACGTAAVITPVGTFAAPPATGPWATGSPGRWPPACAKPWSACRPASATTPITGCTRSCADRRQQSHLRRRSRRRRSWSAMAAGRPDFPAAAVTGCRNAHLAPENLGQETSDIGEGPAKYELAGPSFGPA